jgi:hypothetical protein
VYGVFNFFLAIIKQHCANVNIYFTKVGGFMKIVRIRDFRLSNLKLISIFDNEFTSNTSSRLEDVLDVNHGVTLIMRAHYSWDRLAGRWGVGHLKARGGGIGSWIKSTRKISL